MAYYYITADWRVYKSVGARKVKRIHINLMKKSKGTSHRGSEFIDAGIVFAPYIPITIQSTPVVAQARKLSAKWTVDLEQDLKAMHGIDINRELSSWWGKQHRNVIPIQKLRKKYTIIYQSKNFHDIVFEFANRELEKAV